VALIETDDVERLFRGLVEVLGERDPARLQRAFQVAELYQQLLPYRTYRTRLGFDSNQDYEGAVLGLLAGLGGFATVEPLEVQETLAAEAASPNPDCTLFHEFAGALVRLNASRVRALTAPNAAYAPPAPAPSPPGAAPATPPPPTPVFVLDPAHPGPSPPAAAQPLLATACAACGRSLPTDRAVVFCPYCGRPVGLVTCERCGDELEPDWRFCPRCGRRVDSGAKDG
jgi:RNA polymerase subunit RPABC4/transcription elongation factor Spt4